MSQATIHFHLEKKEIEPFDQEGTKKWLDRVISEENKSVALLNYILCSDEYLLEINKQYLDHDYYTDIISFPLKEDPIEGDIYISVDRVRENAMEFGATFQKELHRVMVHGLLHFIGYDDHAEEDIVIMREKEEHYLEYKFTQ